MYRSTALSRCSLLYFAIRGFSSRPGSPRKHHHIEKRMNDMDDDDWLFRAARGENLWTTWRTRSEPSTSANSCESGMEVSRRLYAFVCGLFSTV
nr:MAG TPA: hypothetical protein [Caudoviricetes sp.]